MNQDFTVSIHSRDPEWIQKWSRKSMDDVLSLIRNNVKDVNKYLIYDNNEVAGLSFSTLSKNEMNQYSYDDCSEINLVLDDIQESIFYNSFSTFHDILPFYLKKLYDYNIYANINNIKLTLNGNYIDLNTNISQFVEDNQNSTIQVDLDFSNRKEQIQYDYEFHGNSEELSAFLKEIDLMNQLQLSSLSILHENADQCELSSFQSFFSFMAQQKLPCLKQLVIKDSIHLKEIDANTLLEAFQNEYASKLKLIDLSNCQLGYKLLNSLSTLPDKWFSSLEAIILDKNDINDEILRPLLETLSRICPSLIRLSIAQNLFTDQGFLSILSLFQRFFPRLIFININQNSIEESTFTQLFTISRTRHYSCFHILYQQPSSDGPAPPPAILQSVPSILSSDAATISPLSSNNPSSTRSPPEVLQPQSQLSLIPSVFENSIEASPSSEVMQSIPSPNLPSDIPETASVEVIQNDYSQYTIYYAFKQVIEMNLSIAVQQSLREQRDQRLSSINPMDSVLHVNMSLIEESKTELDQIYSNQYQERTSLFFSGPSCYENTELILTTMFTNKCLPSLLHLSIQNICFTSPESFLQFITAVSTCCPQLCSLSFDECYLTGAFLLELLKGVDSSFFSNLLILSLKENRFDYQSIHFLLNYLKTETHIPNLCNIHFEYNQPPNSEEEKEIQTTCTEIQKELINRSYYIQLYNDCINDPLLNQSIKSLYNSILSGEQSDPTNSSSSITPSVFVFHPSSSLTISSLLSSMNVHIPSELKTYVIMHQNLQLNQEMNSTMTIAAPVNNSIQHSIRPMSSIHNTSMTIEDKNDNVSVDLTALSQYSDVPSKQQERIYEPMMQQTQNVLNSSMTTINAPFMSFQRMDSDRSPSFQSYKNMDLQHTYSVSSQPLTSINNPSTIHQSLLPSLSISSMMSPTKSSDSFSYNHDITYAPIPLFTEKELEVDADFFEITADVLNSSSNNYKLYVASRLLPETAIIDKNDDVNAFFDKLSLHEFEKPVTSILFKNISLKEFYTKFERVLTDDLLLELTSLFLANVPLLPAARYDSLFKKLGKLPNLQQLVICSCQLNEAHINSFLNSLNDYAFIHLNVLSLVDGTSSKDFTEQFLTDFTNTFLLYSLKEFDYNILCTTDITSKIKASYLNRKKIKKILKTRSERISKQAPKFFQNMIASQMQTPLFSSVSAIDLYSEFGNTVVWKKYKDNDFKLLHKRSYLTSSTILVLDLSTCVVDNNNINMLKTILKLPTYKNLESLILSNCSLKDSFVVDILNVVSSMKHFKNLDLSNNSITDGGLHSIASWYDKKIFNLEELNLSHCYLTHDGILRFMDIYFKSPSISIKSIDFSYNRFSYETIMNFCDYYLSSNIHQRSKLKVIKMNVEGLTRQDKKNIIHALRDADRPQIRLDEFIIMDENILKRL